MNSSFKSILSPRGILSPKTVNSRRQSVLSMKTPSRLNLSSRFNQSTTSSYSVDHFGTQLPVLVAEALKFSDGNSAASVNVSSDGWAWFVCGRRLLVWQVHGAQCRELSLPHSDLAHRAHLITVYTQQPSQMPCCLAVSPEGIVRYWSSVAHESSWTETNAELQGQECDSLHPLLPLGALLVTTTATLVLVTPTFAAARHSLVCRPVKMPHGWLGGISRKMSSFIFGSLPATQIMETKLVRVTTSGMGGEWTVTVLAGHSLQKWQLRGGDSENLLLEGDLSRPLRQAFLDANKDIQELLLLDMQAVESPEGVMLLVAGAHDSSQLTFALVLVKTQVVPLTVSWFRELTADELGPLSHTQHDSTPQLLLMGHIALVYNNNHIVAIPILTKKGEVELLDFGPGHIIDGALYGKSPVFFTTVNGFISVSSGDSAQDDLSMSIGGMVPEQSVTETNIEELTQQKDNVGLMKAAFLMYIKKQLDQSKAVVANLFCGDAGSLDSTAVVKTSLELIDDVPSKDPRWADQKSNKFSISSTHSLQIVHQLEEKQKVLERYVTFLKDLQLWDKLGTVTVRDRVMATSFVLQEHAEKVAATLALKKYHPNNVELIDKIIEDVLLKRSKTPFGNLTNQDLFYRQVSQIHEGIQQLVRWSEDVVFREHNSQLVANQLVAANTALLEMLRAVSELRERVGSMYHPGVGQWEMKLWTTVSGSDTISDSLSLQIQLTVAHGVKTAGEPQLKAELLDQLMSLVDFVLDGRKSHVQSLRDSPMYSAALHQYEADRLAYLQLFMSEEEYERAAMLGEKYLDFQILVDICDRTRNKEKLNHYIEKFSNQAFSKFLFSWYIREQKQSTLVQHCSEKGGEQLATLLKDQPSLSWLYDLERHNYQQASDTLTTLAKQEVQLLQRKKTQLSLAKLTALAAGAEVEELTSGLTLVSYQENLPEALLRMYGYDPENMKLLTPSELVKMYISDENPSNSEFSYKTALDILPFIQDNQEQMELRNEVWCRAILRDNWTDMDPNSPQTLVRELFFFRLFDLCMLGCEDMVPSIESILSCEDLGHLREDTTFQYFLQVGYEQLTKDSVMAAL
ncbi:nuclear pore complex protein Nup133 [Macrosteles quadrilineatus]|uniref:nuclear pore complex protein Nup133 n=1 Tax=Macrosteles quadrilineatus TaxID=74068 RepID=UPI0023E23D62|nr:nuclear pore complex protein Nup133 [Macrosteles quadrilineatus]